MKLSVVILNWNAAEDTAACVRSVRAWESAAGEGRPAILVVDNGSDPPGIEQIRQRVPRVPRSRPANRGFAGGFSLGDPRGTRPRQRGGPALDDDAGIDEASVAALLATLESDPFDRGRRAHPLGPGAVHLRQRAEPRAPRDAVSGRASRRSRPWSGLVTGTVALVQRQVFDRVGLLDRGLLLRRARWRTSCQRARASGFRSVTEPGPAPGATSIARPRSRRTLRIYLIVGNRFLFVRKHSPAAPGWLYARWTARAALTALAARGAGPRRAGPGRSAGRARRPRGTLRRTARWKPSRPTRSPVGP